MVNVIEEDGTKRVAPSRVRGLKQNDGNSCVGKAGCTLTGAWIEVS